MSGTPDARPGAGKDLAIAIPAFNERESIAAAIASALRALDEIAVDGIVFVVDDGSTDGTGEIAEGLARQDARVVVRHHERNLGFTGAIKSALQGNGATYVYLCPADGQVPFDIVPEFWASRRHADIVVGVRRNRADSVLRRILSWGFHFMSRLLLQVRLPEFSSVLLFPRRFVDIPTRSAPRSAGLLSELIFHATMAGARFAVVRYRHLARQAGRAKGGDLRVAARTFAELLRLAVVLRRPPRT